MPLFIITAHCSVISIWLIFGNFNIRWVLAYASYPNVKVCVEKWFLLPPFSKKDPHFHSLYLGPFFFFVLFSCKMLCACTREQFKFKESQPQSPESLATRISQPIDFLPGPGRDSELKFDDAQVDQKKWFDVWDWEVFNFLRRIWNKINVTKIS